MISTAAGPIGFGCGLQPTPSSAPDIMCRDGALAALFRAFYFKRCVQRHKEGCHDKTISSWHLTSELQSFSMHKHSRTDSLYSKADGADFFTKRSYRSWLRNMEVSLPHPISPVCYGGSFAVKKANIVKARAPLLNILDSLSRGDNILEGHYAERTWAGMLSSRLPTEISKQILHLSFTTMPFPDMIGCLFGCIQMSNGECSQSSRSS